MPDWLDALIKIVTFVLAFYAVMSAFAAKRQAIAAEEQAKSAMRQAEAAERQAESATAQAKAAERQLDIMSDTLTFDRIGQAYRIRRIAGNAARALTIFDDAMTRRQDGNEINRRYLEFSQAVNALEDAPPIFPRNVRAIMFDLIQQMNQVRIAVVDEGHRDRVQRTSALLQIAMDVAIADQINALKTES